MSTLILIENSFELFIYLIKCCIIYRLGRFAYDLLRLFYIYWLAPRLGIKLNLLKYQQKWTVITGPTDGIGKAYLYELANQGLRKFLLISRDSQKLKDTSDWLLSSFPNCDIKIVQFTFGYDDYGKLEKVLAPLDVGILVNNAGTGPEILHLFAEAPATDRMVYKVNTESVFELMQIVLPKMKEAKCGVIVNVSSFQSLRPMGLIASYSASKAYVSWLTDCVNREYRLHGIIVQCLIPNLVATKILHYNYNDMPLFDRLLVMQPKKFAQAAVRTLGVVNYTTGCWWHELQLALVQFVPWWFLRYFAEPYYQIHQRRLLAEYHRKKNNVAF